MLDFDELVTDACFGLLWKEKTASASNALTVLTPKKWLAPMANPDQQV